MIINKYMELEENLMCDIVELLEQLGITNYKIQNDGSVDVYGDVDLKKKDLTEIPIRFGFVLGDFDISRNNLTSLKNSPVAVKSSFNCMHNELESLEYSPVYIGNDFACSRNKLKDLSKGPMLVRGDYGCAFNPDVSEEDVRNKETQVNGQTLYYNV